MPRVKVDGIGESDGVVFPTLPAGQYKCRYTEIELMKTGPDSKHPGNDMLRLAAKVCAGEEHEGFALSFFSVLPHDEMSSENKQRAISRNKRICIAAGLEVSEDDTFDTDDLMGEETILVVNEKEVNGIKQNNVTDQLPV